MAIDIDRLRAGLAELTEAAERSAPPSRLDLGLIRSRGRRMLTRRRYGAVLAGVGATAAVSVLLVAMLPVHGGAPKPTAATSGGPAVSRSATSTPTPVSTVGTDPLVAIGEFGWLPAGMTVQDRDMSVDGTATTEANGGASITTMSTLTLTVYKTGTTPTSDVLGNGDTPHHAAAPDVDGHPAYWVNPPKSGPATRDQDVMLRWQYASGDWAELQFGTFTSSEDHKTIAYHVASTVSIGAATPVPLPISLPRADIPADVTGYGASYSNTLLPGTTTGATGWEADLNLQTPVTGGSNSSSLQVRVVPASTDSYSTGASNTTVDGQRAYLSPVGSGDSQLLTVYRTDGLNIHLTLTGKWYDHLKPSGGALALYHQLTVYGPHAANWTTSVLTD